MGEYEIYIPVFHIKVSASKCQKTILPHILEPISFLEALISCLLTSSKKAFRL